MAEKLFLHACCAPCACWPVDFLKKKGFEVAGFWCNPNIHPLAEYRRRRQAFADYSRIAGLEVVSDEEYDLGGWFERTREGWAAKDREKRCSLCYLPRLERTVVEAKRRGFAAFSTTLLYSRYQFHERIAGICADLSEKYGVRFVYFDFREGWQKGIAMSKEMGLYRQRYCGCLFSGLEAQQAGRGSAADR
jgi:predicted adenine nucleotide alpha hydrolase (AANH) superfamily ATPase